MFINCIIALLICIIIYLLIHKIWNRRVTFQENPIVIPNRENFVPISGKNIQTPPYNDVVLNEQAIKKNIHREEFENDLTLNYTQEPIINDVPINIIYDNLTTNYTDI